MPKKTKERPEKRTTEKLFEAIKEAIEGKNYSFTYHALERSQQRRNVSDFQVIRLLKSKSKYHEKKKDSFSDEFSSWNYAIRGKSIDSEDIRVILSFDESEMLVITVINLDE